MQFFILFIGAMVFVFFHFEQPPLLFHPVDQKRAEHLAGFPPIERSYEKAFTRPRAAARSYLADRRPATPSTPPPISSDYRAAQREFDAARANGLRLRRRRSTTPTTSSSPS